MFPKYKGDYYGSFVFDETKSLIDKGFEVHVITQHNQNTPYEEMMEGVYVHRFMWLEPKEFRALVHFRGIKDYLRILTYLISLFFKLIRICYKYKINLIHAHSTIPTGFIAVIVSKIFRIPSFITAHGMDINNFENNPSIKPLISFSLNNCDKAIAVSADLAEKMKQFGVNENKIMVLRNAVDINRFKPINNKIFREKYGISKNEVLIIFVGYLDTFKGVFELINAFCRITKKYQNVKLLIVGGGPKREELGIKVSDLGLSKFIIFTGKVSQEMIQEYYQMADIFVLPSHTEGLPLVVVEAMSCGLPVVVSNVGGSPEIVKNGENGFLVSPGNEKDLFTKLEILVSHDELRNEFGKKSLEIINEEFKIEKKAEKLIELYENFKDY
jgi:N-acetyl-alpha-D-glucosaminyl L-malate synthase BshA